MCGYAKILNTGTPSLSIYIVVSFEPTLFLLPHVAVFDKVWPHLWLPSLYAASLYNSVSNPKKIKIFFDCLNIINSY